MSKHDLLTREEFDQYHVRQAILEALDRKCQELGLKPSECKVLDWGCGRMRGVLRLRAMGYDAYGVDVDLSPVTNGKNLAQEMGYDANALFRLIGPEGRVDFPDNTFHFIFSDHVFEHVADMERVAREISRLTRPQGGGVHIYPGKWAPWEAHLMIPFAHWTPKFSMLRKLWINFFTALGIHCHWNVDNQKDVYFNYLNNKTFYRSAGDIKKIFGAYGLKTYFDPLLDKRVERLLFGGARKNKMARGTLVWLVTTFKSAHFCYQKI